MTTTPPFGNPYGPVSGGPPNPFSTQEGMPAVPAGRRCSRNPQPPHRQRCGGWALTEIISPSSWSRSIRGRTQTDARRTTASPASHRQGSVRWPQQLHRSVSSSRSGGPTVGQQIGDGVSTCRTTSLSVAGPVVPSFPFPTCWPARTSEVQRRRHARWRMLLSRKRQRTRWHTRRFDVGRRRADQTGVRLPEKS